MPIRIFTIRFNAESGFPDDETVNRFLFGRKVNDLRKEFFVADGHPFWSVLVDYDEIFPPEKHAVPVVFNEKQQGLFKALKEWRKKKAGEAGLPVYLVATNSELKNLVLSVPDSLEKLKSIRGFGAKKIEKYGPEILKLMTDICGGS